ncbi:MAG TPA: hypothetical protein DCX60_07600, partial [Phycisphaerales bacterium]|nr:hypothetical protein [Phycisphaerales bacterium]
MSPTNVTEPLIKQSGPQYHEDSAVHFHHPRNDQGQLLMIEMTHQELLDFADLDVLGLLDEVDSTRFEAAFQKATPADQDLIRERQAALATQLVGAPDAHVLSAELKARVLGTIQSENDAIDSALAPVARIGIGRWRP